MIRIANGSAFWGDSGEAPIQLLRGGPLDYLTLDYLAEITMSILQKQKQADPLLGYRLMRNVAVVLADRLRSTDLDVLKLTTALSLALGNR